jgi:hypothetical protein
MHPMYEILTYGLLYHVVCMTVSAGIHVHIFYVKHIKLASLTLRATHHWRLPREVRAHTHTLLHAGRKKTVSLVARIVG